MLQDIKEGENILNATNKKESKTLYMKVKC